MGRFQITCINKRGDHYNPHERISHIGNSANDWRLNEDSAIERIRNQQDSFYTLVNGREAEVVIANHNGRDYLKTTADSYRPDNLLALGDCGENCKIIL